MQDAHSAAMRLISIKRRTEKEVCDLLIKKGFSEEEAQEAAAYYKEAGYIDDNDYAVRYAKDAVNIGKKGPARIRRELCERGVCEEAIEAALSDIEFDLLPIMEKKFGALKNPGIKEKQKIINHFVYKGFEINMIQKAMNALFGDDRYE